MQAGVLNQGAIDVTNRVPDPRSTNPALYRSTGALSLGTIDGITSVRNLATTANVLEMVIDKRYYSDVEGFQVGDKIYWSADVRVTAPMNVQLTVSFYAGGNEDTVASITPQTPADGWVRHYAVSTITATPAGSYFDFRIRPQQTSIPVGQGFYFRKMQITRNKETTYFDGSTPANASYTHEWSGVPNNSPSYRRLITSDDVMTYRSRVLVNGVERSVLSWSVSRELSGDLPNSVAGGAGVVQATGSVSWADSADVADGRLNPWDTSTGWIPATGDRVQIFAGDGVTEWSQFVGEIDTTSGDIGGGITSKIIDRIDDMSVSMNHSAISAVMPPIDPSEPYRRIGLSAVYVQDLALRRSGFYTTPSREFGAVLDVPMQSSCWPHVGSVRTCRRGTVTDNAPVWFTTSFGQAVSDVLATYEPSTAKPASSPVQISMVVAAGNAGVTMVRCFYGSNHLDLTATATMAQARVNGVVVAQVATTWPATIEAYFDGSTVEVRNSNGGVATGSGGLTGSTLMSSIQVVGDANARAAGIQVSHPTAPAHKFASIGFTPTAQIDPGPYHGHVGALPRQSGLTAADTLGSISEALLRPMWIDETGVARMISSVSLRNTISQRSYTTLDDIRELSWESNLLGVRSEVTAKYLWPSQTLRRDFAVTVWTNSNSDVLLSGDSITSIAEPGSNEDWIMVDPNPDVLGATGFDSLNRGIGTLAGGVYTDGATEVYASRPENNVLAVSMSEIVAGKWAITHTASTLTAGWQVELRTVSEQFVGTTNLWPMWWGKETAIVRAKERIEWVDKERTPTIAGTVGPKYEHDFGPWATGNISTNETFVIDQITNFVAEQVSKPAPVITGLRVGFDPRIQLGDVITISSPNLLGVNLRCLIIGVNTDAGDEYTQSFTVRIIEVTSDFTTYAQFAEAWGPTADYASFAAAWGAVATYADFNNNPLGGTA